MRVPVGNSTSIQELAAAVNELYDVLQWQDPVNNQDLGKIEPAAQFLRTGLKAYADGVNWNPNSQGAGYYRYTGSAWVKFLEPDDTFTTSIDADKLDGHHWSEIPNIALTKYFESAEQTITSAGSLTIAHGLGVEPKLIQLWLICKTAEHNHAINDKIVIDVIPLSTSSQGVSITINDTTNIRVRFGSNANVFACLNQTTGVWALLTNANWKAIFRAWA